MSAVKAGYQGSRPDGKKNTLSVNAKPLDVNQLVCKIGMGGIRLSVFEGV